MSLAFVGGFQFGQDHPSKLNNINCPQVNVCKALQDMNPDYEVIYKP